MEYRGYPTLKENVKKWISENEKNISEIIKTEFEQHGDIYLAKITYEEK